MERRIDVAVALQWDGQAAPRVVAKGRGELAARIAELAAEHGVPIDGDPQIVEVLATVDIGRQVPESLFVAVAEILAFAYSIKGSLPGHLVERYAARRRP